jgi:hypothetical protein
MRRLMATKATSRKLTDAQVQSVRDRHAAGETGKAIAATMGVTPAMVSAIVTGKCWRKKPVARAICEALGKAG